MNNHICSTCSEGVSICEQQQYHQGNRVRHLSSTSPYADECLAIVIPDFSDTRPSRHDCPTRRSYFDFWNHMRKDQDYSSSSHFSSTDWCVRAFSLLAVSWCCENRWKQRFTPIRILFTCHLAFSDVCSASSYMMKQTKQTKLKPKFVHDYMLSFRRHSHVFYGIRVRTISNKTRLPYVGWSAQRWIWRGP